MSRIFQINFLRLEIFFIGFLFLMILPKIGFCSSIENLAFCQERFQFIFLDICEEDPNCACEEFLSVQENIKDCVFDANQDDFNSLVNQCLDFLDENEPQSGGVRWWYLPRNPWLWELPPLEYGVPYELA